MDKRRKQGNGTVRLRKNDQGIGKCAPQDKPVSGSEDLPAQAAETHQKAAFEPYKGKIRKSGTGCVTRINDHLWEGRYSPKWPDGKRHPRNSYAGTELECEEKLAALILQTKADIATAKQLLAKGRQVEAMALIDQRHAKAARIKEKISA